MPEVTLEELTQAKKAKPKAPLSIDTSKTYLTHVVEVERVLRWIDERPLIEDEFKWRHWQRVRDIIGQ